MKRMTSLSCGKVATSWVFEKTLASEKVLHSAHVKHNTAYSGNSELCMSRHRVAPKETTTDCRHECVWPLLAFFQTKRSLYTPLGKALMSVARLLARSKESEVVEENKSVACSVECLTCMDWSH